VAVGYGLIVDSWS